MARGQPASATKPLDRPHVYATLDGLRGVAALVVVTRHISALLPDPPFPESFLAVDLFFLLSGFVIAHAYEARMLEGRDGVAMSLAQFMRLRLIRLYPLYALGIGLGLLAALGQVRGAIGVHDLTFLIEATVIGLLMLPGVPPLPVRSSTLDGPTWTLFPELLVNLVYAAALRRLGPKALGVIVAASGLGLMVCEKVYGTLDEGWSFNAFPLTAARLGFSFFLGVALFRLRLPRRTGSLAAIACLAVLGVVLMIEPAGAWRQLYELLAVLIVFPAIVAAAVQREPGPALGRVCRFLGLVSYAVYVLHQPLGELVGRAIRAAGWRTQEPTVALTFMAGLLALCALIDRVYDAPVRRWLQRRSGRRRMATHLNPAAS